MSTTPDACSEDHWKVLQILQTCCIYVHMYVTMDEKSLSIIYCA